MRLRKPYPSLFVWPIVMGILAYRAVTNLAMASLRFLCYGRMPQDARNILVFRTGSLGDSICAFPAIAALKKRFPQATIDILTNAGASNFISIDALLHPDCYRDIIDYCGRSIMEIVPELKSKSYDLVIELPQYDATPLRLFRNLLFFRWTVGIRKGFGWQCDNVNAFRTLQERHLQFENERLRLLGILAQSIGAMGSENDLSMNIQPRDEQIVDDWMRLQNLDRRRRILAIIPGAKRHTNTWPRENVIEVARHFVSEMTVVLCGGVGESELADSICRDVPGVISACGAFTPIQTAVFQGRAAAVITNDTGPLHLAYTTGTSIVAIFSSRDYAGRWYPIQNENTQVFRASGIDCAPCFLEACPHDNKCLREIRPEMIIEATQSLLQLNMIRKLPASS
jgi:ADP-heptose:LPS heptosyltransferase